MATYDLATQSAPSNIVVGDIINCSYVGVYKSISLPAGTYKLEVWGAQGNVYNNSYSIDTAGKGGYSVGILTLSQNTTLYLYTGGQPAYGKNYAGWNGGGTSGNYGGGGGGASDIRIGNTDLAYRVIVAGGGGGGGFSSTIGGYGGGATGGQGGNGSTTGGYGGTSTAGGSNNVAGSFGNGGNSSAGGGGGGGWYGGSSGAGSNTDSGGGGGSGFVFTSSHSASSLSSSYYLTSASTTAGNNNFPSPSGNSETGHSGNGHVRITVNSIQSSAAASTMKIFIKTASSTWTQIN